MRELLAANRHPGTITVPIADLARMVTHDEQAPYYLATCADLDERGLLWPVLVHRVKWEEYLLWRRNHCCT
ncbi:MAG: hypothetical protein GF346_07505, partial [Candidatus Eisenbacteria bacterium]|nr:hypothetical protein [Candidatus Eisenbacteria bacterium]